MLGAFFFGVDGWLSGVSLHWNLCDAEVQQSVWRSTGRGKDGCEMTGRQAAELLGLALDAEGAPWRTHPSSRTSRHIGGARCCCGLFIYGSISFRESTVATTGQSRSADADHPHSTQQAPAIRPEASSKKMVAWRHVAATTAPLLVHLQGSPLNFLCGSSSLAYVCDGAAQWPQLN